MYLTKFSTDIRDVNLSSTSAFAISNNRHIYHYARDEMMYFGGIENRNAELPSSVEYTWNCFVDTESFEQVSSSENHVLALTRTGRVYSWGSNEYGQLGHGDTGDRKNPTLILTLKSTTIIKVFAYSSGDMNVSLALDSDGILYAWGKNYSRIPEVFHAHTWDRGELVSTEYLEPGVIDFSYSSYRNMAVAYTDSLILIDTYEKSKEPFYQETKFNGLSLKKVSCMLGGYIILLENGHIISLNIPLINIDFQQLNINMVHTPFTEKIIDISSSDTFAFALSDQGSVFAWGSQFRMRNMNETKNIFTFLTLPRKIDIPYNVKKIHASHNKLIFAEGEIGRQIDEESFYNEAAIIERYLNSNVTTNVFEKTVDIIVEISMRYFCKSYYIKITSPTNNFIFKEYFEYVYGIEKTFTIEIPPPAVYTICVSSRSNHYTENFELIIEEIPFKMVKCELDSPLRYGETSTLSFEYQGNAAHYFFSQFSDDYPETLIILNDKYKSSLEISGGTKPITFRLYSGDTRFPDDGTQLIYEEVFESITTADVSNIVVEIPEPINKLYEPYYIHYFGIKELTPYDYVIVKKTSGVYPNGVILCEQIQEEKKLSVTFYEYSEYEFMVLNSLSNTTTYSSPAFTVEEAPVEEAPVEEAPIKEPELVIQMEEVQYESWEQFIEDCDIPELHQTICLSVFNALDLDINHLLGIDTTFLGNSGIATPNVQLAILSKIQQIKESRIRSMIKQELTTLTG
eukprot:TRINITY_DN4540_c0_g1_i2.p1 TRINITY_DN4540_c0_g1~~TRINITY_DN4540_c0_g1_i2.p1  ORF type:complete len:834 (-),score=174.15 TRINITY_DN4540_c0_g1_i2:36-2258(-)